MKKIILIISVLILQGCATVDIRPTTMRAEGLSPDAILKGTRILQQAVWQNDKNSAWERFDEWRIKAKDSWKANFVRRLTPIEQPEQEILFVFRIDQSDATMEYLNGKSKGQVIGQKQDEAYRLIEGKKFFKPENKIRLYLEPVRDYFFWPQSLVNAKLITYAGEQQLEDRKYHKVFVTDGPFKADTAHDQFMVWIDKETFVIDYIEFTLRDLLKSYKGVVQYTDYREFKGISFPHHIILLDKIGSESYSHEFFVQEMELTKDPNNLSLIINMKKIEGGLL